MIVFKPPHRPDVAPALSVFLAGSIEMGKAEEWQTTVEDRLSQYDITIFNPRRDDWDSSWEQSIHNENFNEQVTWELDYLTEVSHIFLYFDPNTKSPISLLELGAFRHKNLIVCCPDGFYRKGNVEIFCGRDLIPVFNTFDDALNYLEDWIKDVI